MADVLIRIKSDPRQGIAGVKAYAKEFSDSSRLIRQAAEETARKQSQTLVLTARQASAARRVEVREAQDAAREISRTRAQATREQGQAARENVRTQETATREILRTKMLALRAETQAAREAARQQAQATREQAQAARDEARRQSGGAPRRPGMSSLVALESAGGLANAGQTLTDSITRPVIEFARVATKAASDTNESLQKSQVVFGQSAASIERWAQTSAGAMGISRQAAIESAATFGNLFRAVGLNQAAIPDMSRKVVQLASDLASFNNSSPEEAIDALRAGLVGEVEPLRRFGVNLSEVTLKQEAFRLGLIKTTKVGTLDPQIRTQAAYSLILKQTTTAQGDFLRTANGVANQERKVAAEIANTQADIGKSLIPLRKQFLDAELAGLRFANRVTEGFRGLSREGQGALLTLAGFLLAGGPVLVGLGRVAEAVLSVRNLYASLGPASRRAAAEQVAAAETAAAGQVAAAGEAAAAQKAGALATVGNWGKGGIVLAALAGLSVELGNLANDWDKMKKAEDEAADSAQAYADKVKTMKASGDEKQALLANRREIANTLSGREQALRWWQGQTPHFDNAAEAPAPFRGGAITQKDIDAQIRQIKFDIAGLKGAGRKEDARLHEINTQGYGGNDAHLQKGLARIGEAGAYLLNGCKKFVDVGLRPGWENRAQRLDPKSAVFPVGTILHLAQGGKGTTRHWGEVGPGQHFVEDASDYKRGIGTITDRRSVADIRSRIIGALVPDPRDIIGQGAAAALGRHGGGTGAGAFSPNVRRYDAITQKYAAQYGVSADLIRAVMQQESGGDPLEGKDKKHGRIDTRYGAAQGLMQLMPGELKRYGVTNPYDPDQAIRGGVRELRGLMDRFGPDLNKILIGYNAGPGRANLPFDRLPRETQNYIRKIRATLGRDPGAALSEPSAPTDPDAAKRANKDADDDFARFTLGQFDYKRRQARQTAQDRLAVPGADRGKIQRALNAELQGIQKEQDAWEKQHREQAERLHKEHLAKIEADRKAHYARMAAMRNAVDAATGRAAEARAQIAGNITALTGDPETLELNRREAEAQNKFRSRIKALGGDPAQSLEQLGRMPYSPRTQADFASAGEERDLTLAAVAKEREAKRQRDADAAEEERQRAGDKAQSEAEKAQAAEDRRQESLFRTGKQSRGDLIGYYTKQQDGLDPDSQRSLDAQQRIDKLQELPTLVKQIDAAISQTNRHAWKDSAASAAAYYDGLRREAQDEYDDNLKRGVEETKARDLLTAKQRDIGQQQAEATRAQQDKIKEYELSTGRITLQQYKKYLLERLQDYAEFSDQWIETSRKIKEIDAHLREGLDAWGATVRSIPEAMGNAATASINHWRGFKGLFLDVLDGIKSAFAAAVGQMVAKWATLQLTGLDGQGNPFGFLGGKKKEGGAGTLSAITGIAGAVGGPLGAVTSVLGNIGSIFHFSKGGPVPGFGSHDTVPAMLTPGEFVLSKPMMARLSGKGSAGSRAGAGAATQHVQNVTQNVYNPTYASDVDVDREHERLARALDVAFTLG